MTLRYTREYLKQLRPDDRKVLRKKRFQLMQSTPYVYDVRDQDGIRWLFLKDWLEEEDKP